MIRLDWRLIAGSVIVVSLLGWWGYTKLLIYQRDEARREAVTKPIEAAAEAEHRTAIERIKEIEEEYRETNDTSDNGTVGTVNLDWMW